MASQVRSVYLALHYFGRTCRGGLLYEVKIGKNGKIFRKSTEDKPDCSAMKLFDENDIPEVPFVRCVSHASKLYLFVGQQYKEYEAGAKVAYILDPKTIFDANTKSLNSLIRLKHAGHLQNLCQLMEDGTSIYSLTTPYQLEGLKKNFTPKFKFLVMQTEYMAPFGDLEFCLVRSMRHNINTFQPLWITTFKIIEEEGKKSRIETLDRTVQFVSTEGYGHFWIKFCFTPDYEPKEAMLTTKKEDIQKERNRIKGSSREVDCFIPAYYISKELIVQCSVSRHFEPNEESFTNEKVGIQKEMNSVKPSPCKVECVTSFELGEESVTRKRGTASKRQLRQNACPWQGQLHRAVKLTEEKVKRTEKKGTKRDSHILSIVKRHVSTVKSYGRTDIPVACIILFICLFGFFRLENGEAPLLLGKRIGIGMGM
ncbi:hypothetical protein M0R45_030756 [Rubus argutus]|uniref:Uncharacterized protein n=1 Tax=Rubus argutus TaxID=59490 RepID=A0AAW1WBX4_RUBAR